MLEFLKKYAGNVHSQNGEDFLIREAIGRIGIVNGTCVEIGGNDGRWMSNTRLLIENGWHGRFIETNFDLWRQCVENWKDNPNVRSTCSHVDKYNINAFVQDDCDLLSLDTDGSDYELFNAMRARPKIVIVEIDSSIKPPSEAFNSDGAAGYWSMVAAGLERGYFVLAHTGNIIFVRQEYGELFPECAPHPLLEWERYFNRAWIREAA